MAEQDKWSALRKMFASGDVDPEGLAEFLRKGGTLDHPAEIMQIMQGGMGLKQLQGQNELQPLRMQLIQGMADQMGQPMQNPYMNMPTATPRLPGVGEGGMGSTPAGPSGMGMPDFSNLRAALMGTFGAGGDAGGGGAATIPGDTFIPDTDPFGEKRGNDPEYEEDEDEVNKPEDEEDEEKTRPGRL